MDVLGGHSILEVTGMLGQQLETRALLVTDFSPKKGGHSERRPKIGGQTVSIRQNFANFPGKIQIRTHFKTKISKTLTIWTKCCQKRG